eukprot:CAMPEP_0176436512 /NCGR_PEP_ID=MMETSP0127-20121128/18017_1 /TAXON_ID=938130 /ORGANISM="Platyophrya macrostoma, Strain WH" /LENGTH=223 /DNA_ID=CAMNT_0017819855 /DNA_START=302 /DNA_END=973 /DNA_ORIENTATION=-
MSAICDTVALQKRYHEKQSAVHPDQQAGLQQLQAASSSDPSVPTTAAPPNSAVSLRSAEDLELDSSYANAAYETLRDPFRRCRYLLKYCVAEEKKKTQKASQDTFSTAVTLLTTPEEEAVFYLEDSRENLGGGAAASAELDQDFLEAMMEMNEFVHGYDGDDTASDEDKAALKEIESHIASMDHQLFEDAVSAWKDRDTPRFRDVVLRWTYVNNLKQHIRQAK